jgi:hypothetical protein
VFLQARRMHALRTEHYALQVFRAKPSRLPCINGLEDMIRTANGDPAGRDSVFEALTETDELWKMPLSA